MNNNIGDQFDRARAFAGEKATVASEQIRDISIKARENAAVVYDASREKAGEFVEKAEELAGEAKVRGAKVIQENPLAVVAGGLALGILVGALFPKARKKAGGASTLAAGLMAAKGVSAAASGGFARAADKIRHSIDDIDTSAAKAKLRQIADVDKAKAKIGEYIDTDAARGKIGDLIEKASEAVSSAGKSAAETLRRK